MERCILYAKPSEKKSMNNTECSVPYEVKQKCFLLLFFPYGKSHYSELARGMAPSLNLTSLGGGLPPFGPQGAPKFVWGPSKYEYKWGLWGVK